jgi:hypothetical protein
VKSYFLNGVILATTTDRLDAKVSALGPSLAHDPRLNKGTPHDLIQRLRPVLAAGIDYVVVNLRVG